MKDKHKLVTDIKELDKKHMTKILKKQEAEMKKKDQKYITHKEVMKKYGYLLKDSY